MNQRKDKSGVIFKNDKKSDSHPDFKGQAMVDGSDYWLSVWINESKAGRKYMSVKFNLKDEVQNQGMKQAQHPTQDFEQDLPF